MSNMERNESIERFSEGLKKASSRARELAVSQGQPMWISVATSLEGLLDKGMKMANSFSRSKSDIEADLQRHTDTMTKQ